MKADDRHAEWVRALIAGRQEDAQRLTGELFASGDADSLYPFLYYAFAFAIRRVLRGEPTYDDVIRVVAALRAGLTGTPVVVDPVAAESEILRALGDPSAQLFPDRDARATAEIALLCFSVHDMDLNGDQIDELLRQAREAVQANPRQEQQRLPRHRIDS